VERRFWRRRSKNIGNPAALATSSLWGFDEAAARFLILHLNGFGDWSTEKRY
jgi:hypothetical protein